MKTFLISFAALSSLAALASYPPVLNTAPSTTKNVADYPNGCPTGFPLDCGNTHCCPAGHSLYCGVLEPNPCVDPTGFTPEKLRSLREQCNPMLICQ
jgi:hypothetical protein